MPPSSSTSPLSSPSPNGRCRLAKLFSIRPRGSTHYHAFSINPVYFFFPKHVRCQVGVHFLFGNCRRSNDDDLIEWVFFTSLLNIIIGTLTIIGIILYLSTTHWIMIHNITVCLVSATWWLEKGPVASVFKQCSRGGTFPDRIRKYKKVQKKIKKVQESTG